MTISVPAGAARTIRYSSVPGSRLDLLAIYRLAIEHATSDAQRDRLQAAAREGRHWMLSPYRELTLVHATRQPVWAPKFDELDVKRLAGMSLAVLSGGIWLDQPSTGELELIGATEEWVDTAQPGSDPTIPLPRELPVARLPIGPPDTTTEIERALRIELSSPPGGTGPTIHQLGDTKFRRIRYRVVATSRWAECFPPETGQLTRASEPVELIVPASAPPEPPRVRSVTPAVSWKRSDSTSLAMRTVTSTRLGGILRVVLDRPWYSSGGEESLAVLTMTNSAPEPRPIRPDHPRRA